MERRKIGVVSGLFRYPVKSMLGENPEEIILSPNGTVGDRAWAIREVSGGIASAKKWANLLRFRASYDSPPGAHELPPVTIEFPDGTRIRAADLDASERLSKALGRPIHLERAEPGERSRAEIDPRTIFADVPVEQIFPDMTRETLPDTFRLMEGAFFDSAPIHVLASGSLQHMKRLCGADSVLDPRRFRPNIVVDTGADTDSFVEDSWIEGILEVGESVQITAIEPALRCVMTTHAQADLPRDLAILRTTAKYHNAKLGVFARIGASGTVGVGDSVVLIK
jgi:uncharacterized protein